MAIPILLTVGALGAGWVALSRKRATLENAAEKSGTQADGAVGVETATESAEPVTVNDDAIAGTAEQGGRVVTTEPSPTTGGKGYYPPEGSLGGSDPSTLTSSVAAESLTATSRSDGTSFDTAKAYYGTTNGLSSKQQAVALAELGPQAGEVW